ncbi:DUF2786 domain-containing protein [Enterobacter kobei]
MENKEKYIQRIKKLLAMARNNSSAEEAALALRRAQRLMETHKLTEADADLMDINEASTQKAPLMLRRCRNTWQYWQRWSPAFLA